MFSLIIPVYNEEALIDELASRSVKAVESFTANYEILFINDGSTDSTLPKLIEARKRFSRIKIVDLSRNFGHQAAFTAGLELAMGNCVAMMDGDLQDPPEGLNELHHTWVFVSSHVVLAPGNDFLFTHLAFECSAQHHHCLDRFAPVRVNG